MGIAYGTSGCLLVRPVAARRLSQLVIDNDKDWQAFGMTNVKEIAEGMVKGDIVFHDGNGLKKLSPGSIGTNLTTHDFGNDPTWSIAP